MSRESFLRCICEQPDDDTARLVFADWLDENDDPDRAEFIRKSCELARLLDCGMECNGLEFHVVKLLRQYGHDWFRIPGLDTWSGQNEEPFCGWWRDGNQTIAARVDRGVVDRVAVPTFRECYTVEEECKSCNKRFDLTKTGRPATCSACGADWHDTTHIVPAPFLRAIFQHQPIIEVDARDKLPGFWEGGQDDRAGFWWEPGMNFDAPRQVPFWLGSFGVSAGFWRTGFHGGIMVYVPPVKNRFPNSGWDTPSQALRVLHRVTAAWCRAFSNSEQPTAQVA